jgi:hypothetical protein
MSLKIIEAAAKNQPHNNINRDEVVLAPAADEC